MRGLTAVQVACGLTQRLFVVMACFCAQAVSYMRCAGQFFCTTRTPAPAVGAVCTHSPPVGGKPGPRWVVVRRCRLLAVPDLCVCAHHQLSGPVTRPNANGCAVRGCLGLARGRWRLSVLGAHAWRGLPRQAGHAAQQATFLPPDMPHGPRFTANRHSRCQSAAAYEPGAVLGPRTAPARRPWAAGTPAWAGHVAACRCAACLIPTPRFMDNTCHPIGSNRPSGCRRHKMAGCRHRRLCRSC